MRILPNFKVSHKLGLVVVVTLLGLAAIGAVYGLLFQLDQKAEAQIEASEVFVLEFQKARSHLNTAALAAERFFATDDASQVAAFEAAMAAFNDSSAELEKLKQSDQQLDLIIQVRAEANSFQRSVLQMVEGKTALGLDQDSGLYGQMRAAVNELEVLLTTEEAEQDDSSTASTADDFGSTTAAADEAANLELQVLLLTMRRHEKDYIQREEEEYVNRLADTHTAFLEAAQNPIHSAEESVKFTDLANQYFTTFLAFVEGTQRVVEQIAGFQAQADVINGLLDSTLQAVTRDLEQTRADTSAQVEQLNIIFVVVLGVVAVFVILLITLVAAGITRSLGRLSRAVREVAAGDLEARAAMTTGDELGQLGKAFDSMLDERLASLAAQAEENEKLNESVITLMDATDRLSKRDLTVRVPVGADATGNISDALNMMTSETARVMGEINGLAAQLEQAATAVQQQGNKVAQVAADERKVVDQALQSLAQSSDTMTEMAELTTSSNELAANTSDSTKKALGAVRNTVQSMNEIRNTVSETEKSIKRLGERSQEIGAIVEIIKDIAERTHTLALNAGMQAVAAGDAGRGFSVVADEVQRLAETARESTDQIARLVNSIQAESSETMATMNKTIGQVVEGSELAERSGKRMRLTQKATQELVAAVQQIAERSKSLVAINETLRGQATQLQASTQATEQELEEQSKQTQGMFKYLQDLVGSVRVFKLPEAA